MILVTEGTSELSAIPQIEQEDSFIMSESPEQVKQRLHMRGFSSEQVAEMQRLAQAMAQQQVQRAVAATNNFVATVVALLSSAVGFVAAFAWNSAIQQWLNTFNFGNGNKVENAFIYAGVATIFAVIVIGILGLVNSRIKGSSVIHTGN